MGASLNIFKITEIDKDKLNQNQIIIPIQNTFADVGIWDEIKSPKSILNKIGVKEDLITFRVKHYAETKKSPVRVYWEDLEENSPYGKGTQELNKGYQEIFNFPLFVNLKENEVYIFTKKDIARSIQKRINKSGIMKIECVAIDLSKIDECAEANNIWGIWEDGVGRCKKKAFFGVKVNEENQHQSDKTTTYNLEYEYGDGLIDLIISHNGVISSRSKEIKNEHLLEIYHKIKELH